MIKKDKGVYWVLEAGSTHMGKKQYVKEIIERSKDAGADCVKFQLFDNISAYTDCGNVYMSDDLFAEAVNIGKANDIGVTASVFSKNRLDFLIGFKVPFIKFAYSKSEYTSMIKGTLDLGHEVVVSRDVMNVWEYFDVTKSPKEKTHGKLTILFCIPKYPVYGTLDCDAIMATGLFDGFSDHTLGVEQTKAFAKHSKMIEKHVTLEYSDVTCPDRRFAINFEQAKKLLKV